MKGQFNAITQNRCDRGPQRSRVKESLDEIHGATLAAFRVPERDRYQIVHEHPLAEMKIEDTGLDIPRTERIVMVQATTRPRSRLEKQTFYGLLCQELTSALWGQGVGRRCLNYAKRS
jgi:hypothetical protein